MISAKKLAEHKRALETRIADLQRSIATAEQEARAWGAKTADVMDQATIEYEKQLALRKASADRQLRKNLVQALERIRQGAFGECANCGNEIEPKRLEAIPWARYCIKSQEAAEQQQ